MNKAEAVSAYAVLAQAKLGKMKASDKFAVIRALANLKMVKAEWDGWVAEVRDRLKPENWDALQAEEDKEKLAVAAQAYQAELEQAIMPEAAKEAPEQGYRIGDEALGELLDANPEWTAATAELVMAAVGKSE